MAGMDASSPCSPDMQSSDPREATLASISPERSVLESSLRPILNYPLSPSSRSTSTQSTMSPEFNPVPELGLAAAAAAERLAPPPGCSEYELDQRLARIKKRLATRTDPSERQARTARLVEAIRQTTETLVWGERHDSSLFDLFCEHQMLAAFIFALRVITTPHAVKVQVLQTISILVQNVHRTTSFFYLLSGGLLNTLFDEPPILDEEELLNYFVTLLKSLALRLDSSSARLCLVATRCGPPGQPLQRLPIFECGVKLLGHRDSMVRTAARTALLSLLRVDDALVRNAVEDAVQHVLAPSLAAITGAARRIVQHSDADSSRMHDALEDLEDLFGFVSDLFNLDIPAVTKALEEQSFSVDSYGRAMLLEEPLSTSLVSDLVVPDPEAGQESAMSDSAAFSLSRLEYILEHHSTCGDLPFPYELHSSQNMAAILGRITAPLVEHWEFRHMVVNRIMTAFNAQELCLDLDGSRGENAWLQLEKRFVSHCMEFGEPEMTTKQGLVKARRVLRCVVASLHEVCKQALPLGHTSMSCGSSSQMHGQLAQAPPDGQRYHVYACPVVGGEIAVENLSTNDFSKAKASLDQNSTRGYASIIYDRFTGRSTFQREKNGSPLIFRAVRAARAAHPAQAMDVNLDISTGL